MEQKQPKDFILFTKVRLFSNAFFEFWCGNWFGELIAFAFPLKNGLFFLALYLSHKTLLSKMPLAVAENGWAEQEWWSLRAYPGTAEGSD